MSKPSTLDSPDLLRHQLAGFMGDQNQEAVAKARRFLAHLIAIRELIAPIVIARGLDEGDDWVEAVADLITPNTRQVRDEIQALDDRLHGDGVQTDVFDPWADDPEHRGTLTEAVVSVGMGYGTAGYLLGLAVGSLVGPHVFDRVEGPRR
jgi:hypothetical protein